MSADDPMSAGEGPGPGRGSGRLNGQPVVRPDAKIIPLTVRSTGSRDPAAMKAAVVQVVRHLVLEKVPAGRRSPLFDQARALLDEAGWGLDELVAAAEDGPARQRLFSAIGL
jgi:hypothetical protein